MADRVIWERDIDHDKIADRKQTFIRRFSIVAAVIAALFLVLSGGRNWLGALVVIGLVGAAWGSTVRYQSLSDQANPVMVTNGGILCLGPREVFVEDVTKFTTVASETQTSVLGKYSRIHIGKAIFRLDSPGSRSEPKLVEFGWPNMREEGVASVKQALEPLLQDKWVEPTELVEADEFPKRRRPKML